MNSGINWKDKVLTVFYLESPPNLLQSIMQQELVQLNLHQINTNNIIFFAPILSHFFTYSTLPLSGAGDLKTPSFARIISLYLMAPLPHGSSPGGCRVLCIAVEREELVRHLLRYGRRRTFIPNEPIIIVRHCTTRIHCGCGWHRGQLYYCCPGIPVLDYDGECAASASSGVD